MLGCILQGFLQNAEKTKVDLLWQLLWDVFRMKVDLHTLPIVELSPSRKTRSVVAALVQCEDVPVLPAWLSRLAGRSTVVFSGKSTSSTWSPSSFIAASKRTETAARAPFRLRRGFIDSKSAASDFFSV